MKLLSLSIISLIIFSYSALADEVSFTCKSPRQTIKFTTQDISEVNKESSTLLINKKEIEISRIEVTKTEYGVGALMVQVGEGPAQFRYRFNNLGSASCLDFSDSKQSAKAYVDVFNALGKIDRMNCKCINK